MPGFDLGQENGVFLQKSREFLGNHAREHAGQPFFLFLSLTDQAPEATDQLYLVEREAPFECVGEASEPPLPPPFRGGVAGRIIAAPRPRLQPSVALNEAILPVIVRRATP